MIVRPATTADGDKWTDLRSLLWPGATNSEDVGHYFQRAQPLEGITFVAESPEGTLCGFAEVSIRREFVEGATSSPVAYLEGLFVLPSFRHRGIARQLIEASERWARAQACLEFASDTELGNEASISVHLACGFTEVERAVAFIKRL